MSNEIRERFAINFDLKIERLEKFYSKTNPKGAYDKIRTYMEKNGFEHRQWSGYITKKKITKYELVRFAKKIHADFPWLIDCEDKMDVTVIADIFDIKQIILDSTQEPSESPQKQNLEVGKNETPQRRLPSSKPTMKSPKL